MTPRLHASILPMTTAGTQNFIERTYRESGTHQWVRETYINAVEADASHIEFGIEWQAVENLGVYRRVIADDGCGMSPDELVEFFNTFGGGGKPIGGVHENFGVGSKTSLLPWNTYGMVVVSWQDGEPAMIWVMQDPETGEYGLRLQEVEDPETGDTTLDEVYGPYIDHDHGCDWSQVKPAWMGDHGTVIVLLGNDPGQDTVLGDPSRDEDDIKGVSTYLNRRIWDVGDIEVVVDELRNTERSKWPTSEDEAHGSRSASGPDRRTNARTIRGARYFIEYPVDRFKSGRLAADGTVTLQDGTKVEWFLWEGDRPAVQSYAAIGGYIGALYRNELYNVSTHVSTYRSFGVSDSSVRQRLRLIIRPRVTADGTEGVYPRTDRNSLLLRGGPSAGGPLPINDWAAEFAESMPDAIQDAIREARGDQSGTIEDTLWRERLADRFGSRWRVPKLRARRGGSRRTTPGQPGTSPRPTKVRKRKPTSRPGGDGGTRGEKNTGSGGGDTPAEKVQVAGGLPTFRTAQRDEFEHEYSLAAWLPYDPDHPEGVVILNVSHPVLESEIEHWQRQYPDPYADDIADEVIKVYGEMAVAKVAHSEHLKGIVPSKVVDDQLRSEFALTTALLGLIGEEAILAPRIGGKYRKRRSA
jgi:hypothetical protein